MERITFDLKRRNYEPKQENPNWANVINLKFFKMKNRTNPRLRAVRKKLAN